MELKTKKLGDLAKINYGYTAKASFEINGPKFLRITDIQDGIVNWSTVPSCELSEKDFIKHKLETDDIVFARTGATTGKSFLIKEVKNSVAASYLIRLRLISGEILPEFVYVFFQTKKYWDLVEAGSTGSAQGGFNASKLSNLEISYPPIPEQKRIVALLDTVFADLEHTRAKTEQNLKNARELFDSYLQQVFSQKGEGWPLSKLVDTVNIVDSLHKTPKYSDNGYPMVRVTDIKSGELDLSNTRKVDKETYLEFSKRYKANVGDIVFSRVGSYGRSVIVNTNEQFCLGQNTVFLAPRFNGYYFYYFLNSPIAKEQIDKMVSGSTQPTVSLKSIKSILIPIPTEAKQAEVVQQLKIFESKINRLEAIYRQKSNSIDELKKSILQKAFSGELTHD